MLGDIGGFNDGLQMCLGYILLIYNGRWYFIKLNLTLFKISLTSNQTNQQQPQRFIDPNHMRSIYDQIKNSEPCKLKFFQCFKRNKYQLQLQSFKRIEDSLDIKNLIKAQIFNKLAFEFILSKQELGYIQLLEKHKRLLYHID